MMFDHNQKTGSPYLNFLELGVGPVCYYKKSPIIVDLDLVCESLMGEVTLSIYVSASSTIFIFLLFYIDLSNMIKTTLSPTDQVLHYINHQSKNVQH